MSEDWLIVGISKQRQTYVEYNAIGLDCPDKGARNGGLAIIDRHTLEVVKYINLQDLTDKTSSNVQEIRLMDERDWASHLDEDNSFFSLDLPN
jgi:hypothetical protein